MEWMTVLLTKMFIDETVNSKVIKKTSSDAFHALWIDISIVKKYNLWHCLPAA